MRNIYYLLIAGVMWLCAGCQDVTVGFLFADAAKYNPDTMHIFSISKEIDRLTRLQDDFNLAAKEIQDEIGKWQEKIDAKDIEIEELYDEWDEIEYELDYNESLTDEERQELEARLDEMPDLEYIAWEEMDELVMERNILREELENLATDMGMESPQVIASKLEEYNNKVSFKLPWTTASIENLEGTEPLHFSIVDVKNVNPENAAKFLQYVRIMGGGKICVDIDLDVPVGAYTLSILIENEGRSKVIKDVFTFVVDAEDKTEAPE